MLWNGGTCACEDSCTSFLHAHVGRLRRPGTFHEFAKDLSDDVHAWVHAPLEQLNAADVARNSYSTSKRQLTAMSSLESPMNAELSAHGHLHPLGEPLRALVALPWGALAALRVHARPCSALPVAFLR